MNRRAAIRSLANELGNAPFAWGAFDCCAVPRRLFALLHGYDPAPELIYSSEGEAAALIEQHGGLSALITHVIGTQPLDVEDTQLGDVLHMKLPAMREPMIGVHTGQSALVPWEVGFLKAPIRYATHGWAI